jgi:hypothetical protein
MPHVHFPRGVLQVFGIAGVIDFHSETCRFVSGPLAVNANCLGCTALVSRRTAARPFAWTWLDLPSNGLLSFELFHDLCLAIQLVGVLSIGLFSFIISRNVVFDFALERTSLPLGCIRIRCVLFEGGVLLGDNRIHIIIVFHLISEVSIRRQREVRILVQLSLLCDGINRDLPF